MKNTLNIILFSFFILFSSMPVYGAVVGSTNTGLDIINSDEGLKNRVYKKEDIKKNQTRKMIQSDIDVGARNADEMNKIIIESIKAIGIANDGKITAMHTYIVKNYKNKWIELHGKKQEKYTTGFHLVQRKGATKKILNRNAIDQIFEGMYNIGFSTDKDYRTKNEDGKYGAGFNSISEWLNYLMLDYMNNDKSLSNKSFSGLTVESGNWENINGGYKGEKISNIGIALLDNKRKK